MQDLFGVMVSKKLYVRGDGYVAHNSLPRTQLAALQWFFHVFFSGHAQWEDRRLGGLAAHGWFSYLRNPGESGFVPQYQVCVIFGSTNQKMPKQNQYCNLVNSEFPKKTRADKTQESWVGTWWPLSLLFAVEGATA